MTAPAERQILHVDIDAFFVSVEERLNPTLKGRPVIVGGDPDSRGVVAACSYEARKYGVHSAMPLTRAKRLCPQAVFLRGHYEEYGRVSRKVLALLQQFTPDVEAASIDEAYLDLTGFERLYGPVLGSAERIKSEILKRAGVNASIGIATGKLVAKVASDCAKPNGILRVLPGQEARFLAPLSIERLPGVGEKTRERLHSFGVRTIGAIAAAGEDLLVRTFGAWGLFLYEAARGVDASPIAEPTLPKSISRETTFDQDTIDRAQIDSTVFHLVEDVGKALREVRCQARCITLKLRYSDFSTVTRSITLDEGTDLDRAIYRHVQDLFARAYTRRQRIRLLGVGLSHFVAPEWQPDLFEGATTARLKRLYRTIDKVRDKYGFDALQIVKKPDEE